MKIRIYNARILTMRENDPVFWGEVHIEDEKIVYVGEKKEDEKAWDRKIDARGNLIMPGFKNAHTHSPMTFLRSFADDLPLQPWLQDVVFPAEAKLTVEDTYWLSLLAIMEYLTSGVTAVFDMYFIREGLAKAARKSGFKVVFCGAMNDFCESIAQMEEDYLAYNGNDPLLSFRFGFHAEYTTNRENLKKIAALAQKYHAPVYTHLAETKAEVEECIKRTGMTPLAYLDSLGIFAHGGGGFHMVHMSEADRKLAAQKGLYVITNPASNLKLASGVAPICQMMEQGIPIAIGTDGPASNNCLDMFREMFLVTGLQKALCQDATAVPAQEVLKMATVNGAKVMGLRDADVLAEGKAADLIMIDMHKPNMQPVFSETIHKNLVYSGSKDNVKLTMVNGRILYEDGRFYLNENQDRIYSEVEKIKEKV